MAFIVFPSMGNPLKSLDFYGTDTNEYQIINQMSLTQGLHTISFEGIGKHPLSSGFNLDVRVLNLLNAQARAQRDARWTRITRFGMNGCSMDAT